MPIDVSMYNTSAPAPLNPLGVMGNALAIQGQMNQNRLFQQEFAGRNAIGQIIGNHTNPLSGETDWQAVMAEASQNPAAARLLPELAQQELARRQSNLQLQSQGQEFAAHQRTLANNVLGSLLAKRDPKGNLIATQEDALLSLADAYRTGGISREMFSSYTQQLPSDPTQLEAFLTQAQMQSMDAAQRAGLIYGTPQAVDAGNRIIMGSMSPVTGFHAFGQVDKQMSPGEASTPTPVYDPNSRQMANVPRSQFVHMAGGGGVGVPAAPAAPGPAPLPAMPGNAPAAPIGVPSAPPLGAETAANKGADIAATEAGQLHTEAIGGTVRINALRQALSAIQKAGATGPGSEATNALASFFAAQTPFGLGKYLPGVDPTKIQNFDEANKYLTNYAMAQASSLGGGTDAKLATALTANASTHISKLAALDVIKANIGLERYKQAMAQAWDAAGEPDEDYQKWATRFATTHDPRAFIEDQMGADHMKAMYDAMTSPERAKFVRTHQWAKDNGYLD